MSHIFISYSRKDVDFAQKIVDALAANDLSTWIDWKSIPKGEDWEKEIYRGIEEADAFLFLISPDSVVSEMCNKEIAHAVKNGKRILPLVLHDIEPSTVHSEISKRNWIFCREGRDDFDKVIEEIHKTLHTDYEWVKYHTRLQVKGLEWERSQDRSGLLRGKELRQAEERLAGAKYQTDPQPTELHRAYLLASQRYELRQRRLLTAGLGIGLAIVAILAVFAWGQRNSAVAAESTAIAEGEARATSQALAEERANLALARLLAVEAARPISGVYDAESAQIQGLLAVESLHHYPTLEGNQVLRNFEDFWNRQVFSTGNYMESVAFSPDGNRFAYLYEEGLSIRNTDSWHETLHIPLSDTLGRISFSPDGLWVVGRFYSESGARIWSVITGNPHPAVSPGDELLIFSSDGTLMIAGKETGELNIWIANTGELLGTIQVNDVRVLALSPDNRLLVTSSDENIALLWDISTISQLARLSHEGIIDEVAFTPDGGRLLTHSTISGSLKGQHSLWDTSTWNLIASKGDDFGNIVAGPLEYFALSPDGTVIASIVSGNEIVVWQADHGTEIARLRHELGSVLRFLSFDPSGQFLFASDFVGIISIWDLDTGTQIARVPQAIDAVSLTTDGRWILSVDRFEGKITEWLWRNEDLIESACLNFLKRNLYEWEWAHYLSGEEYRPTCRDKVAKPVPTSTLDGYDTAIAPFTSPGAPPILTPSP